MFRPRPRCASSSVFRPAFTLVELLVVIAVVAVLVALLLPAVQAAREAARKTQCANNLRQLGLALQNHHDSVGYYPLSQLGSEPSIGGNCRGGFYSWHARILPFIEEQSVYDAIDFTVSMSDTCNPGTSGTLSQTHANAAAATAEVATFMCASDAAADNSFLMGVPTGSDSYAGNAGWPSLATGMHHEHDDHDHSHGEGPVRYSGLISLQNPQRPHPSLAQRPIRIRTVTDGLSHTAAIAERLIQRASGHEEILDGPLTLQSFHISNQARPMEEMSEECEPGATHADARDSAYLGRAWISGWSPTGGTYRHLKAPNSNHCHFEDGLASGGLLVTPSSNHVGGVNVVLADGHVEFFTNDVEQEVWWSLGSRNGGESIGHEH